MGEAVLIQKPLVFEYDNYRSYLADTYSYMKTNHNYFSYRYFSRAAGFQSPNFLKLVIDGKRNLTTDSLSKFSKGLKLNKEEYQFFGNLVKFNQADKSEKKSHYAKELFKSKAFRRIYPLKSAESDYYSKWYFIPVRELVASDYFQDDANWIAKQLQPEITPAQASRALHELEALGLIQPDENGRLRQSESAVHSGNEVLSTLISQYHREMLRLAAESMDRFHNLDREISAVTLFLSEENFSKLKEKVQKFRDDLCTEFGSESSPEKIYQIGLQVFPLTTKIKKAGGQ